MNSTELVTQAREERMLQAAASKSSSSGSTHVAPGPPPRTVASADQFIGIQEQDATTSNVQQDPETTHEAVEPTPEVSAADNLQV